MNPLQKLSSSDSEIAFSLAREYRRSCLEIISEIDTNLANTEQYVAENFDKVIRLAVDLSFSVELYLKSLLLFQSKRPPRTHKLWKVFKAIADTDRVAIEDTYESVFQKREREYPGTLYLALKASGQPEPTRGDIRSEKGKRQSESIAQLSNLLKSADAGYYQWRFVHDDLSKGDKFLRLHIGGLAIFADILDNSLETSIRVAKATAT